MRVLELFSGTKSIGNAFERLGYHDIVSVDSDSTYNPSRLINIMDWDFSEFEPGDFDFIHASPPCTQYSQARTRGGPRDFDTADGLVAKALEIIDYLQPVFWLIENPDGLLKTRPCMSGLAPPILCSYCKYSDWGYRKNTTMWTNLPLKLMTCDKKCQGFANGRHPNHAQRTGPLWSGKSNKRDNLYRIPAALCDEVARAVVAGHEQR